MNKLLYWLILSIVYPLSYWPMSLLYLLSDCCYVIVYFVIGYRRKVVYQNIANSFPEWDDKQVNQVARQFYHNLCDILVESIRLISMPEKEVKQRVNFENRELLDAVAARNQSAIIALGHCGNWEMAGLAVSSTLPFKSMAIYRPLKNKDFDGFARKLRGRLGMELVPQKNIRALLASTNEGSRLFHFITDQTPGRMAANYWTTFLNQETPIYLGTEKVAKMSGLPVYFANITRTSRGHYNILVKEVALDPKSEAPGAITAKHSRLLEENIKQQPDNWLWSHRRWKHTRPEGVELNVATGVR